MTIDIQAEIAKTRETLELLERLAAIEANPVAREMARRMFGNGQAKPVSENAQTAFIKLDNWFKSSGKESATIKEMCEGIGLAAPTVRQMIYNTNRDRFEKAGKIEGSREVKYRLKK